MMWKFSLEYSSVLLRGQGHLVFKTEGSMTS